MPIHDYLCKDCKHEFEEWTQRDQRVVCPKCGSTRTIQYIGAPMVMGYYKEKWDRQPPSPPTKVYIDRRKKKNDVLGPPDKASTRTKRTRDAL